MPNRKGNTMSDDFNFSSIFEAVGVKKNGRGRTEGSVQKHTQENHERLDQAAKAAKADKGSKFFLVAPDMVLNGKGEAVAYDMRRSVAKAWCENNAGWIIAPKASTTPGDKTTAQVILVKPKA